MELNNKLDLEWEEHCNNTKSNRAGGRGGQQIGSKQVLYQAILNNQNVLEAQKAAVGKLARDIGQLKIRKLGSALQHGTPRSGAYASRFSFYRLTPVSKPVNKRLV